MRPHLCGDSLVAVSDADRQIIVREFSCIQTPGNYDGPHVHLNVKVLLLISSWERDRKE